MAPQPLRTDHLALPAYDAAATRDFYTHVMQFPLVDAAAGDDWDGKAWLMMVFGVADGRKLAFFAFRGMAAPADETLPSGARHFAFAAASADDYAAWKKQLESAGVALVEEDHVTQRSIYFSDPNGVRLEITTPAPEEAPDPNAEEIVKRWVAKA
jgi:catechol 2,3-dioxygenase-like lactoylglutathione lyase family enzyme